MRGKYFFLSLYRSSEHIYSRYGMHLSKEEVDALVAPHPDSIEAVESWLQHHGINPTDTSSRSGGGEWVTIRVSVAQAEQMLNTKYGVYHHESSGSSVVRTMAYSLPAELHAHVDVVTPTTYFGTLRSMRATHFLQPDIPPIDEDVSETDLSPQAVPSSCASTITPACLRYAIP